MNNEVFKAIENTNPDTISNKLHQINEILSISEKLLGEIDLKFFGPYPEPESKVEELPNDIFSLITRINSRSQKITNNLTEFNKRIA